MPINTPPTLYMRLPNWVGDVCMALPSLELALSSKWPIVVAARPWAKSLLAAYPLAGFIPVQGQLKNDRKQIAQYRKTHNHADVKGLILHDSLSSALIFRLAGIASAGYRDDGRSLLLKWPIQKPSSSLHAVESWFFLTSQAFSEWKIKPASNKPKNSLCLTICPEYENQAYDALKNASLHAGKFVLIAPTATGLHKGKNKVWPHFDALTRKLQADGFEVIMCPPAAERQQALQNAPTAHCLPPLSLPAFAKLAKLAAVVVCNDSGVSHLAAAVNAQQLTLFGVTDRSRTAPWSENAHCLGSAAAWPTLNDVYPLLMSIVTQT